MSLPGRLDMVFAGLRVAVFVDGDLWLGWRFPTWSKRLPPYWKAKIERNRNRDRRNFRRPRRAGWKVVRVWEHEVRTDAARCVSRIKRALRSAHKTINQ